MPIITGNQSICMYPENHKGSRIIFRSMNMGYAGPDLPCGEWGSCLGPHQLEAPTTRTAKLACLEFFYVTITGYYRVDLTVREFKMKRISVTFSVYWKKMKMYEKNSTVEFKYSWPTTAHSKTCAAQMGSASCSWPMAPTNCFDLGPSTPI